MKVAFAIPILFFVSTQISRAQFSPALLQNDSYWGDGKAEVDFYDAQIMRDGQLRHCEATLIYQWDKFTPPRGKDDSAPPQEIPAVSMRQTFTIGTGLITHQESTVLFWAREGRLLRLLTTQTGKNGITVLQTNFVPQPNSISLRRTTDHGAESWTQFADSTGTKSRAPPLSGTSPTINPLATGTAAPPFPLLPSPSPSPSSPANRLFLYEELPLRVRTLSFDKPKAELEVNFLSSLDRSGDSEFLHLESQPAIISYRMGDRSIEVNVPHDAGIDHFVLDRDFPFLLREWKAADGSTYKLKNSLKVDYQKYLKEGDREKALKDPMLRHPD